MQHVVFRFRKHRPGSSGKTALIPQLSKLQGSFKFGKRKNLPNHGIVQRHSQIRQRTNVSLFHPGTPLGWGRIKSVRAAATATYMNCICIISLKSVTTGSSSVSAGIGMFSVREPGLSIGPHRRSVSLTPTDPPASAWTRWSSSIHSLDASSSLTQKRPFGLSLYFAPSRKTWTVARCDGSN